MRIGDFLYFAPDVAFTSIDLSSPTLGEVWEKRVRAYYLVPSAECIEAGHAFAAGLLLTATIDAMARLQFRPERVGRRFKRFLTESLPSFHDPQLAARFYEDFRNGLTHEARIKNGGEFSLSSEGTLNTESGLFRVNPKYLAHEVDEALTTFVAQVIADQRVRSDFAAALREDFSEELSVSDAGR